VHAAGTRRADQHGVCYLDIAGTFDADG